MIFFSFQINNMIIVYISIIVLAISVIAIHRRVNGIKKGASLSLIELNEFNDLNPEVKAFYKEIILESWIKGLSAAINNEFDKSGVSQFYKENKEQLLKLNELYREIAKLSIDKNDNSYAANFKLLMYNSNLDRLIKDAEAKVVELRALEQPQVEVSYA